jgi:cobalt-zinc-cadmium efflux system membrane fusion protein
MKRIKILILGLLIMSCNNQSGSEITQKESVAASNPSSDSQNMSALVLEELSEINFGESLTVTGMIDVPPQNKATISSFIGGYVVNTPLLVGDKVSKGQVLVSLENPEYVELQQDYLELSEQLTYLESEYQRQKTLYDENITSEKSYLKAQSIYRSTLAHLNGLKKKLQMLSINPRQVESGKIVSKIELYAPMEGYVTSVNVSNGAFVSAQDVIMEIVDTDHIHLELSVFEKDIMKIKKGQKIQFQIPEASTEIFSGEIHLVGTTIDETTRRVKLHGHVDNETDQFIVGMYVVADIFISENIAMGLPKTAILSDDDGDFVIAATKSSNDQNSYEKIEVTLGEQNDNSAAILNHEDLAGKRIVVKGAQGLLSRLQ